MIRRSQKAPGSSLGVFDITRHHRQGLRRMHPDRLHRKSPTGNEVTCTVSPHPGEGGPPHGGAGQEVRPSQRAPVTGAIRRILTDDMKMNLNLEELTNGKPY